VDDSFLLLKIVANDNQTQDVRLFKEVGIFGFTFKRNAQCLGLGKRQNASLEGWMAFQGPRFGGMLGDACDGVLYKRKEL
jgi:hypothetical protein